jgi:ParB family chromosome partitioning protein
LKRLVSAELADSIKSKGLVQPILVRPSKSNPGDYEIIAGERRWRAAQVAQLHEIPAVIRSLDDVESLEIAIIENVQRADLSPIEEAAGYKKLMENYGHTQEALSEIVGKSRSHVANIIRLLSLPHSIQDMISQGSISSWTCKSNNE